MTVQIIAATSTKATSPSSAQRPLRTAAYCRVSTDTDEQETSYEAQRTHYLARISEDPALELAGIFADEGITGTQARKRPEFLRMIAECEAGNVDLVITKSISRFARNAKDLLATIRMLSDLSISVIFEKKTSVLSRAAGN